MSRDKQQEDKQQQDSQPVKHEEKKRVLKVFLEFWLLIGLLAAFNLYSYFSGGSRMFLVVGIISTAAFVAWAAAYVFFFRRS